MALLITVLSGFIVAGFAPVVANIRRTLTGWVLALLPLALFVALARYLPAVLSGEVIVESTDWVPSLGINLDFYLDGLSLMMALLVTGMGVLVFIYGQGYLEDDEHIGKFYLYLTLFMAAMLGLVLAGNVITLFIFWEITSITSYLLIGYKHKYADSRNAALQALLITGSGGLLLLAGLIVIGVMGGSYEFAELLNNGSLIDQQFYDVALVLVLLGCFTKSAQTPFHTWLPGAMAAPTPVSAYLHSATMVKAGIYLLARLAPLLAGTTAWFYGVSGVGALTMFVGAWLSWQNSDLKKILAYSTISVLGTLVMLLGLSADTEYAVEAVIIFLLAHAFYKGSLFMIAGAIDHSTGTREIHQLGGLRRTMPWLFAAAVVAALSKAGIPYFLGFVGKELAYEATLHAPAGFIWLLTGLAVVSNGMVGAAAGLVIIRPFLGAERSPHGVHKPNFALQLGPLILGVLTLLFGILPGLLDALGQRAALSVFYFEETAADFYLKVWHGLNTALILSIITVAIAVTVYALRDRLIAPLAWTRGDRWGAQNWYQWVLDGSRWSAEQITLQLQNGNLRIYLITIVGATIAIVGGTLIGLGLDVPVFVDLREIPIYVTIICLIIILSAAFATRFESRLAGITALGGVGFGMSVLFMLLGAPDLAMTQFSIEVLTVVLIALIMGRLPYYLSNTTMTDQTISFLFAGGMGFMMFAIVLLATSSATDSLVSDWYAANSYPLAQGRNVVNVILVDFRGFDTLGEITVLSVAGIGVFALAKLKKRRDKPNEADPEDLPGVPDVVESLSAD